MPIIFATIKHRANLAGKKTSTVNSFVGFLNMSNKIDYDAISGRDFASVAKGFDFGPALRKVDFPDQFVRDYVAVFTSDDDILKNGEAAFARSIWARDT